MLRRCALCLLLACAGSARSLHRVELHVHLDGSISTELLFETCQKRKLTLPGSEKPPSSVEEVAGYLRSITPNWHRFDVVNDIVGGDAESIRSAARAFAAMQARSGVGYTEVRYDPYRLARSGLANTSLSEQETVQAVQDGLAEGCRVHGIAIYQLLSAMRGKSAAECFQTVGLAAKMRSPLLGGVVGVDLAGDEVSYPNGPYVDCLRHAKVDLGLNTTVHAGEFQGISAEEVRSAVLAMHADRIGHGYATVTDDATVRLILERGVHLEACPESAWHHGVLNNISAYVSLGLSFGINTDDPASYFNNASLADNEALLQKSLGLTGDAIRHAYDSARAAAFGSTGMVVSSSSTTSFLV
eukprot:TRINITY_DN81872_c0_g1_i1.p1 TRINITY_DN81872_c0_g1~~TRINITY_DN81872_c0_g1_i1.p1  ORF type:complete len:357 (-),score=49.00 TRINITY_DN81872_c0_g1_i1:131-1201(-)